MFHGQLNLHSQTGINTSGYYLNHYEWLNTRGLT
jgi:hypothetical protein